MDAPRVEYAHTSDGVTVAYQLFGSGRRNIVFVNGMVCHLDVQWELPGFRHLMERLSELGRVVIFDKRGTGLSDRMYGAGPIEDRLLDVDAVMEAAGMNRAHLVSLSDGVPVALVFAAQRPEQVQSVVGMGGFAAGHLHDGQVDLSGSEIEANVQRVVDDWGTGTILPKVIRGLPTDAARRWEMYSNTPTGQGDVMRANNNMDVTPVLGSVRTPTLLLHCTGDPAVRVGWAHQMAAHIPDATVVEVDADFHNSNDPDDLELMCNEIERFWVAEGGGTRSDQPATRVLATVMFTDLVDSTRLAAELGDGRWRELLDAHDSACAAAVERRAGTVVKGTGDGIMATFDGPSAALDAATELRDAVNALDLGVRVGMHTGEIELRGDDIAGIGVNTAARAMSIAPDNEIWVTAIIPGLVAGSGHSFESRGTHELKGLPEPIELHALTSHTPTR